MVKWRAVRVVEKKTHNAFNLIHWSIKNIFNFWILKFERKKIK